MGTVEVLLLISPLIAISLGLAIYALVDLSKTDRQVKGGNKLVWALVIVLFQTLGPLVYLLVGRENT